MEFKSCLHFVLLFPAPKAGGARGLFPDSFAYLFNLFPSSHLGTPGNIPGFKITTLGLGLCPRSQHHPAGLGAGVSQGGGRSRRVPGSALSYQVTLTTAQRSISNAVPASQRTIWVRVRPRLITWDCSNTRIPQSLLLAYRDATLFSWRGLHGEPIESWAVICQEVREGDKQRPRTPETTEFWGESRAASATTFFFSTGQVGKILKPKRKVWLSRGG